MKKLLLLGVGSVLMFTMGGVGPAQADNGPHMSSASLGNTTVTIADGPGAGKCAGCHRAHTAQGEYLLVQAQPALCYTCHDGTGAGTAVKDGVDMWRGGALRAGGFVKARIGSGLASKVLGAADPATGRIATSAQTIPALSVGQPVTSKHQIDGATSGTAWGNGANGSGAGKSLTLECGSCHDPHGNGNYRILKPIPVDSGATLPVNIPDATAKVYTTGNYWLAGDSNVPSGGTVLTGTAKATDPAGDGYIQNVAAWCTTCHTRYLAPSKSYQTPSGDATFMYRHRSDANYKAGAANCITCHVSHGSNAEMTGNAAKVAAPGGGLAQPDGAPADSRLLRVDNRGTCLMCHNV